MDGCMTNPIKHADPRTKTLGFLLLVSAVLVSHSVVAFLTIAGMVVWLGKTARLSVRLLTKAVCSLWHFFLLVWLMNAFFSETGESLWRWGIFNLTRDGMDQGLLVVVRVAFVIVLGTLYNHIATAQDGINAINWMLTPLSFLFLPVGQISLILGTALQFVPLLRQETARIQKAQKARGASFGKGNFLTKGKNLLPLLLPVFLCAFSHADALATAMEARGYQNGAKRTKRHASPLRRVDMLALSGGIFLVLFCRVA